MRHEAMILSNNVRGILYMVLGMACFTLGDLFVKLACQQLPPGQVMMALGGGCSLVYWVVMKRAGHAITLAAYFEPSVLLRNTGEVIASLSMFAALALTQLSTISAIVQTLPLLLTLVAAVFLGEKVGVHRLSAVVIGFIGVLVVIRPGMSVFDHYSLLALLAVVGMAMRDVGARLTRSSVSTWLLLLYTGLTLLMTGAGLLLWTGGAKVPDGVTAGYLLGLVTVASTGLMMVTQAVRIAEISVVAPFRYVRLLYGMGLGVVVLDEVVDAYTLLGSLITMAAGIYIWLREKRLSVATQP